MCETPDERAMGWQGWFDLPVPPRLTPTGDWIDLSHPVTKDVPRVPGLPAPSFRMLRAMPEHLLNVTELTMAMHVGTHLDSPWHFFLDGPAIGDVPLARMCGRAAVARIASEDNLIISRAMLENAAAHAAPGDMLLLDTGWHRHVGTRRYSAVHPSLDLGAADWLVERRIKLLGCDFPTPDRPDGIRAADFDYPVHLSLLSRGVLIAEHLTNMGALHGKFVEATCAAVNIAGSDGAPARIIAREIADA